MLIFDVLKDARYNVLEAAATAESGALVGLINNAAIVGPVGRVDEGRSLSLDFMRTTSLAYYGLQRNGASHVDKGPRRRWPNRGHVQPYQHGGNQSGTATYRNHKFLQFARYRDGNRGRRDQERCSRFVLSP